MGFQVEPFSFTNNYLRAKFAFQIGLFINLYSVFGKMPVSGVDSPAF